MAKYPGSLWIEGDELHYVDQTGVEWQINGSLLTNGPYYPGSLWVETADGLHYVGQSQREFIVPYVYSAQEPALHNDAAVFNGCLWIETNSVHFMVNASECRIHADVAHQDGGGAATHVDVPGSAIGHGDSHTDSTHGDTHNDAPHGDFHGDGHTDVAHSDGHNDIHDDTHNDIGHDDGHNDWTHTPNPGNHTDGTTIRTQVPPPTSAHTDLHHDQYDIGGAYSHGDDHWDTHTDVHTDGHNDTHSDSAHADDHNDQAHQDSGHVDTHTDGSHGDTHADNPHGDSPHQDHTDATHADVAHVDNPINLGP